jgi:glycosyltransferase involved in cell wall biosynthesis
VSPFFSVVIATYRRGEHIRPTIESALRQSFADLEVIVVGDGCTDATENVVRSIGSERIRWLNLPENGGSQSFPNNAGIEIAAGRWIAYLGHDDIWSSKHLQALHQVILSEPAPDIAVSGCMYHGPPESGVTFITGLFEDEQAKFTDFFPPSSIAHRRDLTDQIGGWADPRTVAAPVDADFQLRAAHAGRRFASTGQLTVHKFAAGHRYLSYLCPDAEEQKAALRDPRLEDEEYLRGLIEACGIRRRPMGMQDFSAFGKGSLFERNRRIKGLSRPAPMPLTGPVRLEQTNEGRGLDWHELESGSRPFRWSGPNPRAKILIPYTYDRKVQISICVPHVAETPLNDVSLWMNGRRLPCQIGVMGGEPALVTRAALNRRDCSVLVLHTPAMYSGEADGAERDYRRRGIAVGDILIEPM